MPKSSTNGDPLPLHLPWGSPQCKSLQGDWTQSPLQSGIPDTKGPVLAHSFPNLLFHTPGNFLS